MTVSFLPAPTVDPPKAAVRGLETDEQLIERLVAGEPEALKELYDRYAPRLLGLALRILGSRDDAEEALQEAFLYAWRRAARYRRSRAAVSTWLSLIVRSRAIDKLRSRGAQQAREVDEPQDDIAAVSPRGYSDILSKERHRSVRRALGELPSAQRRVVELAYFGGLTQSEIASREQIPIGTVKTRTLLAMKKLRLALGDEVGSLL